MVGYIRDLPFHFSIRSLFLLSVCVAVSFSWLAIDLQRASRQYDAVQAVRDSSGLVRYEDHPSSCGVAPQSGQKAAKWLRRLLGEDFFANVVHVTVVDEAGLRQLAQFPRLRSLHVAGREIPDAALKRLEDLADIEVLSLDRRVGADAGLKYLRKMIKLRELWICGGRITDDELEHLKCFAELRILYLDSMPDITDAGLGHLKTLRNLRQLTIFQSAITDAGLKYVGALTRLEKLELRFTNVSEAGIRHLANLTRLRAVDVTSSAITDEGAREIQRLLPDCKILH